RRPPQRDPRSGGERGGGADGHPAHAGRRHRGGALVIALENGRVIDPASGLDEVRTVVVEDGRVTRILKGPLPKDERGRIAAHDGEALLVIPGLIDLHVHLREPGEEYKETIESGTGAAVAGGFTAVVAMPNTKPPVDNAHLVRFVRERAEASGRCR